MSSPPILRYILDTRQSAMHRDLHFDLYRPRLSDHEAVINAGDTGFACTHIDNTRVGHACTISGS